MEFIHQPRLDSRLGDYLLHNLAKPWTHFRAAVAFVRKSGTKHIKEAISAFARTGQVEIIAGIDHRTTSAEGLRDLLDASGSDGRVFVFHNPLPFTFHPKIYLFKSTQSAEVLIGSGNLTEGGLFTNYEAAMRLKLDLAKPEHASVLASIEQVLDDWSDTSRNTVRVLDEDILARLVESGLLPSKDERSVPTDGSAFAAASASDSPDSSNDRDQEYRSNRIGSLFTAERVPPAPRPSASASLASNTEVDSRGSPATQSSKPKPVFRGTTGFVMTLHQTDVGVGQTTPGASRRSPEIFIPLAARDANPDFWDWPAGFAEDPVRAGKLDRADVRLRIGGEIVLVKMMTWPDRHDFRLRSEALRSAGNVGDVLRLEKAGSNIDFDYYADIIRQGTKEHSSYLALCSEQVRNSEKRYGYY